MTHPAGESNDGARRVDFDRRLMLRFRGSVVTSDAGLTENRSPVNSMAPGNATREGSPRVL
jgi:hypothetical protein